jgi:Arc/MetJ family transcription regulator
MRTNIVLDDRLVREAMRLSKARTKRELVDLALREFVARSKQQNILALIDEEPIGRDYDVRAMRRRMTHGPR